MKTLSTLVHSSSTQCQAPRIALQTRFDMSVREVGHASEFGRSAGVASIMIEEFRPITPIRKARSTLTRNWASRSNLTALSACIYTAATISASLALSLSSTSLCTLAKLSSGVLRRFGTMSQKIRQAEGVLREIPAPGSPAMYDPNFQNSFHFLRRALHQLTQERPKERAHHIGPALLQ